RRAQPPRGGGNERVLRPRRRREAGAPAVLPPPLTATTPTPPPRRPAMTTPRAADETMQSRFALLGDAATQEEVPAQAREQWGAPYGPAEDWPVRTEDRRLPGPHGSVPVRIYTPQAVPAPAGRPCRVLGRGCGFMSG